MRYKEVSFKSILNKITKEDNLFLGNYTLDPYQNCEIGCIYCDSSLGNEIIIKHQASELLKKEIDKVEGRVIIGSVHDPYQKAEERYKLTREILKILNENKICYHILTKSDLILRDIDILSKESIVTISLSTFSEEKSKILEPFAPSPKTRIRIVERLNDHGIKSGIAIMPIIPFITDDELEDIIKNASSRGARYILWEFLELKGDQKRVFLSRFPHLVEEYKKIYSEGIKPDIRYRKKINEKMNKLCRKYKIANTVKEALCTCK